MNKLINSLLIFLFVMPVIGQAQITTNRKDGRFLSSRGSVQYMLEQVKPAYAFDPSFTPAEFKEWQSNLRTAMKELMHFLNNRMYRLRFVSKRFSGMAIGLRNGNPIRCRAVSSLIWC